MATIIVDGRSYQVEAGRNLLETCLSLGFDLPYFCWHPALGSVGACRQCAVKKFADGKDTRGRIVMSCMEPVVDGLRISIDDPEARDCRARAIEWMMANHPHDCPVCDEGGECHLQDMTVMTGHVYRRFRFRKRTFRDQDLGPFINQEMNRCIQCYRCVRFYRDYAGGRDLGEYRSANAVFFGRHADGPLESPFAGNLAEVCPTGVFTDKTFKSHFTRKWDLSTAPSVCVHCSLGCNTLPGARDGMLRRVRNRFNGEVNGYFLCDRGRFGYEFENGEKGRVRRARIKGGTLPEDPAAVERAAAGKLAELMSGPRPGRAVGIGSPRASLEANFVLRELVGADRFYAGVSEAERELTSLALGILRGGPAKPVSLKEVERADAVLVLGEDVTNTAPMLDLALRQAVRQAPLEAADRLRIPRWHDLAVRGLLQDARGPLFVVTPRRTGLADVAEEIRMAPDEAADLGFAVARLIAAPSGEGAAGRIASALAAAKNPLVVAGTSAGCAAVLHAAAAVAAALSAARRAGIFLTFPECNSLGLAMMEAPGLAGALEKARGGEADTVIILENDLFRRLGRCAAEEFLGAFRNVFVLDHIETETTARAHVVIPAATYAESEGTLVNNEGRAQRYFKIQPPPGGVSESWRLLARTEFDDLVRAMTEAIPALAGVRDAAPSSAFRLHGRKIARESPRATGRTSLHADIEVREGALPDDPDSPLAFSMEGTGAAVPPPLNPRYWAPGWNSVQSVNSFQKTVGGSLAGGDPGVRLIEPRATGKAGTPPAPHVVNAVSVSRGSGALESLETISAKSGSFAVPGDLGKPQPAGGLLIQLVPLYHIFGSEEMSARGPSVASLSPKPYLLIHPSDAAQLGIANGDRIDLDVDGNALSLPAELSVDICPGAAGVPAGLACVEYVVLPARGTIKGVSKP